MSTTVKAQESMQTRKGITRKLEEKLSDERRKEEKDKTSETV